MSDAQTETIDEWAARTAPTHNWEAHHRVVEGGHSNDDLEAMATAGLITINERHQERYQWSANVWRAEAIEAYRDSVAAGLSKFHQRVLSRTSDNWSERPWVPGKGNTRWATMAALRDRHKLVEDGGGAWRRTPFGREVARVLEASHG